MISLTDGMILYHGSYTEVSQIQLEKCSKGKDFGQGFYLTSSHSQAEKFIRLSCKKQIRLKIFLKIQRAVTYQFINCIYQKS